MLNITCSKLQHEGDIVRFIVRMCTCRELLLEGQARFFLLDDWWIPAEFVIMSFDLEIVVFGAESTGFFSGASSYSFLCIKIKYEKWVHFIISKWNIDYFCRNLSCMLDFSFKFKLHKCFRSVGKLFIFWVIWIYLTTTGSFVT